MQDLINLWPNVVAISQYQGNLIKIKEKILDANQTLPHQETSTTVNGLQPKWDTSPWSWTDLDWLPVKEFINQQLVEYANSVYPNNDQINPTIRRSWTVTYNEGGYQEPHCHPPMDLSVLFVVQDNPGGNLVFVNPAVQSSYSNFQPYSQSILLKEGSLLIWPSWILHYTLPTVQGDDKIVISLDVSLIK
jgi:hypothetical protein